ncbi:hypothetical protein I656_00606 [Geobacillus sp. WSUCF1]|nr:hypothetical protein I656_00606 [Geobacillus sp. WSUCF1]
MFIMSSFMNVHSCIEKTAFVHSKNDRCTEAERSHGEMGKDRQEKKLKQSRRVESDRDQSLSYKGAARLDTPEEARERNRH